ncbi:MAG: hypothetical protein H0X17_00110 [Deltaproteobacteria bacterium]|nr:hypothetical protein [Deltaproteobacteria bacterium]
MLLARRAVTAATVAAAVTALTVAFAVGAGGPPRSAHAQPERGWDIRVPDRIDVALGTTGTLPVSIAVDRGLTISKDAPVIIDLIAPTGVALKKSRLGRSDAADPGADAPRFAIPVRATATGDHPLELRLRLWVCGGRVCRPLDVRRRTTVAVGSDTTCTTCGP